MKSAFQGISVDDADVIHEFSSTLLVGERAGDDRDRDRANRARYPKHFYRWRLALRTLVLRAALTFTPAK